MKNFKQMEYTKTSKWTLLYQTTQTTSNYKYEIIIMSLGTHPTAYIGVDREHPLFGIYYDNIENFGDSIDSTPHGGFTYSGDTINADFVTTNSEWFIGWDYAHYGDHTGHKVGLAASTGRRWTTEQIFEECLMVVDMIEEKI